MRAELADVAGHAVVEARTDGDQHVAIVHGHVGLVGAVHAEHADEQRIVGRKGAEPHERVRARIAEQAHQFGERLRGVVDDDAAAGVEHRPLGREHEIDRLLDLPRMALGRRMVGTHRYRLRVGVLGLLRGHVLRKIDQHRAGPASGGDVEGLLDGDGQVRDVLHQKIVLHARTRDADRVDFLEGVVTDQMGRHLAADDDHRNGIHVGGGDAGDGVGDAGAGGHQHHAGLAGGARVAVGRVGRALLVAHEDVFDVLLPVESVVDVQGRPARVAEDVLDPLVFEATDKDIGASQFHTQVPKNQRKNARRPGIPFNNLSEMMKLLDRPQPVNRKPAKSNSFLGT